MFDYRQITQWDTENIKGFFGEYKWLSNFWPCMVKFDDRMYKCSEAAYMAAKLEDPQDRVRFEEYDGKTAKREGRLVKLRPHWEKFKLGVMLSVLRSKFTFNETLNQNLLATGEKYLEETNWWNDQFWGVDYRHGGQNNLGKILMLVREELR